MRVVKNLVLLAAITAVFVIAAQLTLRWWDSRNDAASWQGLLELAEPEEALFEASMVASLPEVARRYFLYTIRLGTPLYRATELRLVGEIGLGDKKNPQYRAMTAHQLLVPPYGLVWKVRAGDGLLALSGSDGMHAGQSWVRFRLGGLIPVVREGGSYDHLRAAFGRLVAEAVFWAPASLLPQYGTKWEDVDAQTARASVSYQGMTQSVDITIDSKGRPVKVIISRWSNANAGRTYQLQPFGGYLSEFREFSGYRLPTRIIGGNFIETNQYFPFYKATVESLEFIL